MYYLIFINIETAKIFIVVYIEYLSDELQLPNDELDVELLHKKYATLL